MHSDLAPMAGAPGSVTTLCILISAQYIRGPLAISYSLVLSALIFSSHALRSQNGTSRMFFLSSVGKKSAHLHRCEYVGYQA